MGKIVPFALGTTSNKTRHGQEGAARLINCYAEKIGGEGKEPYAVYAIPGLTQWVDIAGAANIRAMLPVGSELITVAGRGIYRINKVGMVTQVGGIGTDGFVTMDHNRAIPSQVAICSEGLLYIYQGGGITQIQDPDIDPPNSCIVLDGYLVTLANSGQINHSNIDDAKTFDALDFTQAEKHPDGGVRIARRGPDAVVFGEQTTEFHQNSGNADQVFQRVTSIDVGCWAAGSVANILMVADDNAGVDTLIFAGSDHKASYSGIYVFSGYTPVKVSNKYVDRVVSAEPDKDSIRSYSWTGDGHSFYCITGTSFSLVYDASEQQWHDEQSYQKSRRIICCHAHFNGQNLFGSREDGKIHQSSDTVYDEDGSPIVMEIWTPPVTGWPGGVKFNAVFVDAVTGVGLTDDDCVLLDYSEDGGKHWQGERRLPLGKVGQTMKHLQARRLGITRNARTWRLRISSDVVSCIQRVAMDYEPLRA